MTIHDFAGFIMGSAHTLAVGLLKFFIAAFTPIVVFLQGNDRLSWPYILTALIIGFACFWYQAPKDTKKNFFNYCSFLKLKEYSLSPSALLDYRFALVQAGLLFLFISPWVLTKASSVKMIYTLLVALFGATSATHGQPGLGAWLLYGFVWAALWDLGFWLVHYLHHKIPFLWEFHKTHHSAPLMVPATLLRVHIFETLLVMLSTIFLTSIVDSVFLYYYGLGFAPVSFVVGTNLTLVITDAVSGNLRHSHIWLSFGRRMEHFISSPAQHQIHHSNDPKHYDKNFAGYFSFWDWLFGTLYTTTSKPEPVSFGLGEESNNYTTVRQLLWTPVRRAGAMLKRGGKSTLPPENLKPLRRDAV